jgi:hypothetical protein
MSGGQAQLYVSFFALFTDYYQITVTYVESGSFKTSSATDTLLVYGLFF